MNKSNQQPTASVVEQYAHGGTRRAETPWTEEVGTRNENSSNANGVEGVTAPPGHELMLQLRRRDGGIKAISYALLGAVDFDPSQGLVLEFVGYRVTLRGRNLRTLLGRLTAHRLPFVQEIDPMDDDGAESETVVTKIQIET